MSLLSKIGFYNDDKKQFYETTYQQSRQTFDSVCGAGHTIRIDDLGIDIFNNAQVMMHICQKNVMCYVCGCAIKNAVKNNVDIGLAHLKTCQQEFVTSLAKDICTVCDKHWLFNQSKFYINSFEHLNGERHKTKMEKARLGKYYDFQLRQQCDDQIRQREEACKFLTGLDMDEMLLSNYIKTSMELVLSSPSFVVSADCQEYKDALTYHMGTIDCRTIVTIIEVLEKHEIKANQIYASTYGDIDDEFDGPELL